MIYLTFDICYIVRCTRRTYTTATRCITAGAGDGNSVSRIGQIATRRQVVYLGGLVSDIAGCSTATTAAATATVVA